MAKGFLAGAIWGLIVSGVGAGAVSVVMGPPDPTRLAGLSGAETETETGAGPGGSTAPDPIPEPDATPEAQPDVLPAARSEAQPDPQPAAETDPQSAGEAESVASAASPEEDTTSSGIAPPPAEPARRPGSESAISLEGGPSLAPAPDAPDSSTADTSAPARPEASTSAEAPLAPDATPETLNAPISASTDSPAMPGGQIDAPEAPLAEDGPEVVTEPATRSEAKAADPEADAGPEVSPEPEAEDTPVVVTYAPEAATAPAEAGTGDATSDTAEAADESSETGASAQSPMADRLQQDSLPGQSAPAIGKPSAPLIGRDGTIPIRRLPAVGGSQSAASGSEAEQGAEGTAMSDASLPPFERFAAETDVPLEEAMLAVVLIDDGSGPFGPETVESFPFPVSIAIAASHPDAAAAARAYRARGFEVLAMAGAPEGAQASDVEVSLEGALAAVPEAIGILEDPRSGLQASRSVSDQAADFLKASGHGLVMLPNGLNTAQALALRAGVPSASVFRDFDGEGQDTRVMGRFLDQAAFKARQEGGVVMLGRLRADTVSALVLWSLQDRANSVSLVPVSAILRASVEGGAQ